MRRAFAALAVVALVTPGIAAAQEEAVALPAPALKEFQTRLNAYLRLREELARKLDPLTPTASSAELTARQDSLAAALRTARRNAKQGDLIPEPVATYIAKVVLDDFHFRNPQVKRQALEEVAVRARPVINRTYPADAPLPTVPPLLLKKLPRLPDNLQYRFFGRHAVILDGDTQIITDYIANVLPPI
jgi:hypothetical protein